MKPKLNQFEELKKQFKAKREARKPFQSAGPEAMNESRKKSPKPVHDDRFFDVKKYDNWLSPAAK